MLVTILITWQLGLYIQCLPLDKHVSFVYMMRGSEFTKKNNFRYSEEVHTLWLQDYLFICWYKININVAKLWY